VFGNPLANVRARTLAAEYSQGERIGVCLVDKKQAGELGGPTKGDDGSSGFVTRDYTDEV
jgi:hypothetical protein